MSLGKRTKTKTEHVGAKNRGGFWGNRGEAKKVSKKHRRANAKTEIAQQLKVESKRKAVVVA